MNTLTSVEQVLAEGFDPAYVVFAMPEWEYFHPTDLPAPIAGWIAEHCPEVEIRRVSRFPSPGTAFLGIDQHHDEITSALGIAPVFMIGFNEKQAQAFAAAWPKHKDSTSENSEFYFCDISAADDPGVHQYDAHGVYCVPGFPDALEQDKGETSA